MIVLRGDMPPLHQLERAPPEVVEILGVGNGGQAAVIAPWPEAKAGNEREIHCKDAAVTNAVIAVDAFDAHDFFNIRICDRCSRIAYQRTADALLICPVLAVVLIQFQLDTSAHGLPQAQRRLVCRRQNGKPSQDKRGDHEQGQQQDQRFSPFPGRVEKCSFYHIAVSLTHFR